MLAIFLLDERFVSHESALIRRLIVGVADEGVRILPFVAHNARPDFLAEGLADATLLPEPAWLGREAPRLEAVLEGIPASAKSDDRRVVHAFGESMWHLAALVARHTDAVPVYEVWQSSSIGRAARLASGPAQPRPLLTLAEPGLEALVAEADARHAMRTVPWGVHTPPEPPPILRPGLGPTVALFGTGADPRALRDALTGIAETISSTPDAMLFIDAEAARAAGLWKLTQRLELTDRVTIIPPLEVDRDLALSVDALLLPEAAGEVHSITLDALAHGRIVIAAADPALALRSDEHGVRVLQSPASESWGEALSEALSRPDESAAFARRGWELCRTQRRASSQVAALIDAWEWATAPDALPFTAG